MVTVDIDLANPTIQSFSTDLGRTIINIAAPTINETAAVPGFGCADAAGRCGMPPQGYSKAT